MIADKDGNVVPVAALKMNAGLRHAGNNVWRVSAFKQVTKEIIKTVTDFIMFTRDRSLTKDVVTNLETRTQMKPVSKIEATQRTRNAIEQLERTVTNIYMATRNQTRSVAASEHTVTKQVTLTGTHPESSVTDIVTRERTVTRIIGFGFLVTGPATITRGVAFDLDIQSYKTTNGQLDTGYVPDTIVQTDIAPFPSTVVGTWTPYSTNNVGWVDGKKTVNALITGGTGSGIVTFWIHDPNSSREGFLEVPIAPSILEIAPLDGQKYNSLQTYSNPGTNDWDAAAITEFADVQNNAQAAFDADTTLSNIIGVGHLTRLVNAQESFSAGRAAIRLGYYSFTVTDPQKAGLKAVRLKVKLYSRYQRDDIAGFPSPEIFQFSQYAWTRFLVLSPSEAGNTYPSGLAMKNMSPTTTIEYTWINQQQITLGGTVSVPVYIYIDIPKEWVADLVGNTLYLWHYIAARSIFAFNSDFASTPGQEVNGEQTERWDDQANTRLVLYT